MKAIERLDTVFEIIKNKYGNAEQACDQLKGFLLTANNKYITKTNNARQIIEDFRYVDLVEILGKYSITKFIKENYQVSLTVEDIITLGNDLEGKYRITHHQAIEFFALYCALNPYYAYNALVCSKNVKPLLIESFIEDRYRNPLDHIKNVEDQLGKHVTLNNRGEKKIYYMNEQSLDNMVREVKEDENQTFNYSK